MIYVFWTWLCYNHTFEFHFDIYFRTFSFWFNLSKKKLFLSFQVLVQIDQEHQYWKLCKASIFWNLRKKWKRLHNFETFLFSCKMLFLILLCLKSNWNIFEQNSLKIDNQKVFLRITFIFATWIESFLQSKLAIKL